MDRLEAYRSWWSPLPVWLKVITAVGIYPAWFLIVYCVFTGASKSGEVLFAFAIFGIGTLLHIVFDRRSRSRSGSPERDGFDLFGGE